MNRWLIIKCDYGQLGNRLHTHANALAWCNTNQFNLLNLSFTEFAPLFQNRENHSVEMFCSSKDLLSFFLTKKFIQIFISRMLMSDKWLSRISRFINLIDRNEDISINEEEINCLLEKEKRINIIKAWNFNCTNSIIKNGEFVRNFLSPAWTYTQKAKHKILELRNKHTCLVGIHARRGDYKNYQNGKHYHSWNAYKQWILETRSMLISEGILNPGFVFCSDEEPDQSVFSALPVHFMDEKHVMIDLYTLSLCNYNIGPTSSYGTWISWHGNVPRVCVQKDTKIQSLNQFSVCSTC